MRGERETEQETERERERERAGARRSLLIEYSVRPNGRCNNTPNENCIELDLTFKFGVFYAF